MNSTGNDIVALKAINIARTKQPNFYRKIISAAEKAFIDQRFSDNCLLSNLYGCYGLSRNRCINTCKG